VQETAKLTLSIDGKEQTIDLPVVTGSEGEKAIDVGALRAKTGFVCSTPPS
jgi:citrate synthase